MAGSWKDWEESLRPPVACHPWGLKSWRTLERRGVVLGSFRVWHWDFGRLERTKNKIVINCDKYWEENKNSIFRGLGGGLLNNAWEVTMDHPVF